MPKYKATIKDYTLRDFIFEAEDNTQAWEIAENSEPDDWEDSEDMGFEVSHIEELDA